MRLLLRATCFGLTVLLSDKDRGKGIIIKKENSTEEIDTVVYLCLQLSQHGQGFKVNCHITIKDEYFIL
jgi:hypothetical protein